MDDDASHRKLLTLDIEDAGYSVHAVDPEEAVEAARLWRPRVVTLDYLSLEDRIRDMIADFRELGAHVLLVTGFPLSQEELTRIGLQARDYFLKPYAADALSARIEEAMSGS